MILWGDSLAVESQEAYTRVITEQDGAEVVTRAWSGTALCDWLDDMDEQTERERDRPAIAVLSFSGNFGTPCMSGRDRLTAYHEDVTKAVDLLTSRDIDVLLVDAPARIGEPVDAEGMTDLHRVWRAAAEGNPRVTVVPAGRTVTRDGQFTLTMPCQEGEACETGGVVTVRNPDGVHFCPVTNQPVIGCPVPSPGAERFGTAIGQAVRDRIAARQR